MSAPKFYMGVLKDGTVNTIAVADAASVWESFEHGEVIVPCSVEQARAHWGKKVNPLSLPSEVPA